MQNITVLQGTGTTQQTAVLALNTAIATAQAAATPNTFSTLNGGITAFVDSTTTDNFTAWLLVSYQS